MKTTEQNIKNQHVSLCAALSLIENIQNMRRKHVSVKKCHRDRLTRIMRRIEEGRIVEGNRTFAVGVYAAYNSLIDSAKTNQINRSVCNKLRVKKIINRYGIHENIVRVAAISSCRILPHSLVNYIKTSL